MNILIHVAVAIVSEASICSIHLRKQVYSCVLMTNYITCTLACFIILASV
jgi:hypothetical protein